MDASKREKIKREIDQLLRERETYLKYGSVVDANRCTDKIAALEKQRQEA